MVGDRGARALGSDRWSEWFVSEPPPLVCHDLPAEPERIPPTRRAVSDWARLAGLTEPEGELVDLAVDASMTLAVLAPGGGQGGGTFSVQAGRTLEDRLVVLVTSPAGWRRSPRHEEASRRRALVVQRCAPSAEVRHTPQGTTIRMAWALPRAR
jgi:hypothetical protein